MSEQDLNSEFYLKSKDFTSCERIKRKMLTSSVDENIVNYILNEIKLRENKIINLQKHIEMQNKVSLPITKIEYNIKNRNCIKIDSTKGILTLSTKENVSEEILQDFKNIIQIIIKEEFPPVVLRGNVYWNSEEEVYKCNLQSFSKKFSKVFVYDPYQEFFNS